MLWYQLWHPQKLGQKRPIFIYAFKYFQSKSILIWKSCGICSQKQNMIKQCLPKHFIKEMYFHYNQNSGCHVPIQTNKHKRIHYKSYNKYKHMQTCKQNNLMVHPSHALPPLPVIQFKTEWVRLGSLVSI